MVYISSSGERGGLGVGGIGRKGLEWDEGVLLSARKWDVVQKRIEEGLVLG